MFDMQRHTTMPIDPDEPYLVFRREYWIKPGILEIEIRLNSWAIPFSFYINPKTYSFKFLCLDVWFGSWADKKFWEEYKNAN